MMGSATPCISRSAALSPSARSKSQPSALPSAIVKSPTRRCAIVHVETSDNRLKTHHMQTEELFLRRRGEREGCALIKHAADQRVQSTHDAIASS